MTHSRLTPAQRRALALESVEPPRDLIGLRESAAYLGVGERFMRHLVAERRIRHYKVGRYLRFSKRDLDAFVLLDVREAT